MQTALVHLRHPVEFAQVIGFWRFCGFVVFIAGAVATSLLGPFAWLLAGVFLWQGSDGLLGPYGGIVTVTSYACLGAGNLALVTLAVMAPVKRRWWGLVPYSLGVFAYWLLISAAAYKALWQLGNRPHHWEKTEHGVAKGATRACLGMRAFL